MSSERKVPPDEVERRRFPTRALMVVQPVHLCLACLSQGGDILVGVAFHLVNLDGLEH